MNRYIILIRGINVGGKNKVPMGELRQCLEDLGFWHVSTYIASGNVILHSTLSPMQIKSEIEEVLPRKFALDSGMVKVLVLSASQLEAIIANKPVGFGEEPNRYHSDVIFLIDIEVEQALSVFDPREGVDTIWPGDKVIYSQRLSAERTKSRLGKIIGTSAYQSMTIRSWNTATKLIQSAKDGL